MKTAWDVGYIDHVYWCMCIDIAYVAALLHTMLRSASSATHAIAEICRNMFIYACMVLFMHYMHHMSKCQAPRMSKLVEVSNRHGHLVVILSATLSCLIFDAMPLTRTFSFTALNNPDYALPVPSSVSYHSQMPAGYLPCKPFIKPPTMPFDRMSFICQSSPLAPSHNSNFFTPPPKTLTPLKPRLNLNWITLISYWGRRNPAHWEILKKCAAHGRVSKKCTPKKSFTTVVNLPVEEKGFEKAAV